MTDQESVPTDAFPAYQAGLRQLLEKLGLGHPRYAEALTYQQRLEENLSQTKRYGDTGTRGATRAEIIDGLNELALAELGTSFNELCGLLSPQAQNEEQLSPAEPQSVRLEITPIERLENNCPHISVVVKNRENKTVFCKAESHGIYNSEGENIERSISSYANHFSWSGGSKEGTKEIPANLDGTINLAKINKTGYGIAFLFDEDPHSYRETEGTYKLDLMIVGTVKENLSRMKFIGQRVMVEFIYIKNETQSNSGEIINNSELKLLTWNLINNN